MREKICARWLLILSQFASDSSTVISSALGLVLPLLIMQLLTFWWNNSSAYVLRTISVIYFAVRSFEDSCNAKRLSCKALAHSRGCIVDFLWEIRGAVTLLEPGFHNRKSLNISNWYQITSALFFLYFLFTKAVAALFIFSLFSYTTGKFFGSQKVPGARSSSWFE